MKNKKKSCPILQEPQIFMLQMDEKHTQDFKERDRYTPIPFSH